MCISCGWHFFFIGISNAASTFHAPLHTLPVSVTFYRKSDPIAYCMSPQTFIWNLGERLHDTISLDFCMPAKPTSHAHVNYTQAHLIMAALTSKSPPPQTIMNKQGALGHITFKLRIPQSSTWTKCIQCLWKRTTSIVFWPIPGNILISIFKTPFIACISIIILVFWVSSRVIH